jgi:uroporphyrinogen decarboxylase
MQHLAVIKDSVLQRLHADTRYIFANPSSDFEFKIAPDSSWYDEWGIKRINVGLYDESVEWPLSGRSLDEVKKYRLPDPKNAGRFHGLKERAQALYRQSDFALIGGNAASLFYLTSEMIGFQEYMEKMLTEPKVVETLIDKVLEWQIGFFDSYLDAIGDYVEMIWMGDDWGTQLGPLISPQIFKDVFAKRYAEFVRFVKRKADVKVALHSCGSVRWAMEEFVKAGIDVLHPLQGNARGLENPFELKREFGNDIVFYSNLRNQTVIPNGSTLDVEEEVKMKISALAPGGGYIMSGGHNIQADVPPENILALVDATLKYGAYPLRIDENS